MISFHFLLYENTLRSPTVIIISCCRRHFSSCVSIMTYYHNVFSLPSCFFIVYSTYLSTHCHSQRVYYCPSSLLHIYTLISKSSNSQKLNYHLYHLSTGDSLSDIFYSNSWTSNVNVKLPPGYLFLDCLQAPQLQTT